VLTATHSLRVADVEIGLSGGDEAALEALLAAFQHSGPAVAPQLLLRSVPGTLEVPDRPPDRVVQHLAYWSTADGTLVRAHGRALALVSGRTALLDGGRGGVAAVRALLLPTLSMLLDLEAWTVVHGAAVLAGGGEVVLVLGGSGSGKSTLVAAALEAGRQVLGDDLTAVRGGGAPTAAGVPVRVALPGDLALSTRVAGASLAMDSRGRRSAADGTGLTGAALRLAGTVLVHRAADAAGTLCRADPREVFHTAMASTLAGLSTGHARSVFTLCAAISRLPAWKLGHAADADRRLAAAVEALREVDESLLVG
jgi:hypothetical protein